MPATFSIIQLNVNKNQYLDYQSVAITLSGMVFLYILNGNIQNPLNNPLSVLYFILSQRVSPFTLYTCLSSPAVQPIVLLITLCDAMASIGMQFWVSRWVSSRDMRHMIRLQFHCQHALDNTHIYIYIRTHVHAHVYPQIYTHFRVNVYT